MNRDLETKEYRFDEEHHIHEIFRDGVWKPLIGVSSVVKDITNFSIASYYGSRRALMELGYDPKLAKSSVEGFRKKIAEILPLDDKTLANTLYGAYKAHDTYSKDRAKLGTDAHATVDKWIKGCIEKNHGKPLGSEDPVVKKFRELTDKYEPTFVASEKHGYNENLWIGGICDVIVDTNIGLGIWDNKNRPAIYSKDILQMGGYTHLFDMGFTHVLGVPLEGDEASVFLDVPQLKKVFENQLGVYKFNQALETKK